jgi:putative transport protein
MEEVATLIRETPLAALMLVVAAGFLLGRLRWRRLALGPAGGTLLVALVAGSIGLRPSEIGVGPAPALSVGALGFSLFLFSVGFEAGPRFFSSLRRGRGWRYVVTGNVVNLLAVLVAVGASAALGLGGAVSAGALAGALTSAPTYAAAAELLPDPRAVSVSFALTYPVGLIALVLLVQLVPRWLGEDLSDDEDDERPGRHGPSQPELTRCFRIANDTVIGRSLRELNLGAATGCIVQRLHREESIRLTDGDTVLERGDHLLVTGRLDELERFARRVGPEVYDEELQRRLPPPRRVLVTRKSVARIPLAELDLTRRHHALVVAIHRGECEVEPGADIALQIGDVVDVVGPRAGVAAVAEELGRFETPQLRFAAPIYAVGILLGLLLGRVELGIGDVSLRVGSAAGLLISGLLIGRLRHVGRFRLDVSPVARHLVRDLGILLFVAETGLRAAASGAGGFPILATVAVGLLASVVPVAGALLVARRLLRLRPVEAWGSVCGGMTSSAALTVVRDAAGSREPAVSYSAAFAVSSVLVTIAGQVVVLLLPA